MAQQGYWPAWASNALEEGRFSEAASLCMEHLPNDPDLISGRLIYAAALYRAGQIESATEQFYAVLARDPENQVALKCLGDIKFAAGDEFGAFANYARVLELDPDTRGVASPLKARARETTTTVTLHRGAEEIPAPEAHSLRQIPFVTETVGDLYLAQGHPRLAAVVFRRLQQQAAHPRLARKLALAEQTMKDKDRKE